MLGKETLRVFVLCEKRAAYATSAQLTRNALTESLRHGAALHLQLNEQP